MQFYWLEKKGLDCLAIGQMEQGISLFPVNFGIVVMCFIELKGKCPNLWCQSCTLLEIVETKTFSFIISWEVSWQTWLNRLGLKGLGLTDLDKKEKDSGLQDLDSELQALDSKLNTGTTCSCSLEGEMIN